MDETDPEIVFDEQGVCNHCSNLNAKVKNLPTFNDLQSIIRKIKEAGKHKKYDCIVGVSGGVDSSYVAYLIKELGLRPLAVHLDNGWNSELAVSNIEKILDQLKIDLYTDVVDWVEFRDLQRAFLKSSTPDIEIPTDHMITASLYQTAIKYKIRYIISGYNDITECIMPIAWSHGHADWKYISSVHKKFGTVPLKTIPHYSFWQYLKYRYWYRLKLVKVLNYINYNKPTAINKLRERFNWRPYGGKHGESIYTRFTQSYWLPKKFGYDKRRAHLSNLICACQISREEALKELDDNSYWTSGQAEADKEYVMKKLCLTEEEFDKLLYAENKSIWDYPSYQGSRWYKGIRGIYRLTKRLI